MPTVVVILAWRTLGIIGQHRCDNLLFVDDAFVRVNELIAVWHSVTGIIDLLFRDECRIAVEFWIAEQAGCAARVINNGERELAVVGAYAGTSTDDLLKLGHGIGDTCEYHILTGWRVNARREKL